MEQDWVRSYPPTPSIDARLLSKLKNAQRNEVLHHSEDAR